MFYRMKFNIGLALFVFLFIACAQGQTGEVRQSLKQYFSEYNVSGTFVLYDQKNKHYIYYNPARAKQKISPASTFKIPNTLIGLELGEIPNEDHVFKWNERQYRIKNWNQDLVLHDAFQFSCVPCYRGLARRIGAKKMKTWLNKISYGNQDISGGVDRFWLGSSLKISARELINFLRKLYKNKLPFTIANQEIVKKIMLVEMTSKYKLYAKSGWAIPDGKNIGWYVGFVEKCGNVYFFATNIETKEANSDFAKARIEITRKILKRVKVL